MFHQRNKYRLSTTYSDLEVNYLYDQINFKHIIDNYRNGCGSPCSPAANQDAAILDAYWERMQEIAKTNYSYVDGES